MAGLHVQGDAGARERGAKAVLFVTGPNSPQAGALIPLSGDNTLSGSASSPIPSPPP
jgi:hypothetical protein